MCRASCKEHEGVFFVANLAASAMKGLCDRCSMSLSLRRRIFMSAFEREREQQWMSSGYDSPENRQFVYLEVIKTIVQEIAHFEHHQPLLDYIVTALQKQLKFYIVSIFWYDREQQQAVLLAQDGQSDDPAPIGYTQSIQVGLLGRTIREEQAFLVEDVTHLHEYVSPQGYAPACSELCVPIFTNQVLWGAFNVESTLVGMFNQYDLLALELIATQLGSTLANLELHHRQQEMVNDLIAHAAQQQQLLDQISELSTPVFPVYPGVLALPLIGQLDNERMHHTLATLLETIQQTQSTHVILDITAIAAIDERVAQKLVHLIQSSKLLGADVIVTGVRPAIAQVLVGLQFEVGNVMVRNNFAAGLQYALQSRGKSIVDRY
jgi:anti-anti-sigma regulatory factor/putative methionine-R-sulfoxide reductase with GAF domain